MNGWRVAGAMLVSAALCQAAGCAGTAAAALLELLDDAAAGRAIAGGYGCQHSAWDVGAAPAAAAAAFAERHRRAISTRWCA